MPDFASLKDEYAATWRAMHIDPARRKTFDAVAARLLTAGPLYAEVARLTGVPSSLIMVIHERESGGNFSTHLHNGDPLTARTVHVPAGRPIDGRPPFSWASSAVDALRYQGLDKIRDWTVERALYVLEGYNGFGYRNRHIRSPYLWGGTDQQQPGKYVRDGVFDPTVMDQQLGCAGLLSAIWTADPSLRLRLSWDALATPEPIPTPRPRPPSAPSPAVQGGLAALVAALIGGFIAFRDQVVAFFHQMFG